MSQSEYRNGGFAELSGAGLYYEVAGDGPPLVLIHAGICDSRMWDDQWSVFARSYRVIRYDLRGMGQSRMPPGSFAPWEDLHGLLQHLGVEKAHLMGGSMGGRTAIDFALVHPEMVASLILLCPAVSGWNPSEALVRRWGEVETAMKEGGLAAANEIELQMWVDGPARSRDQIDPVLRARVGEMNAHNLANASEEGTEQELEPPALGRLREIEAPALIVLGEQDQPDFIEIGHALAAGIRGARKIVMAGTAHLPSMELPEELNPIVLDFLGSLSQGSPPQ